MEIRDLWNVNKMKKELIELRELTFGNVTIPSLGSINNVPVADESNVMKIPTVEACVKLIAGSIAQMPVYLYQELADDSIVKQKENERVRLLNHGNGTEIAGIDWKKLMVSDYLLHGQAISILEKRSATINIGGMVEQIETLSELNHLPAKNLQIEVFHNGIKYTGAKYTQTTMTGTPLNKKPNKATFNSDQLLRVLNNPKNAYEAEGVLIRGKTLFEQALAETEYTKALYNNGAMPKGALKMAGRLSQTAVDKLKLSWNDLYSGAKNAGKTVVLEEGMEYQALQLNPNEMMLTETQKKTNAEICKLFGVPESMISTAANKYGSIEQNQLHFLKHTLGPIIASFEAQFDRQLLTEAEKLQGFFFRFDTAELLRTTESERTETLIKQIDAGLISANEGRKVLDKKPYEEDFIKLSIGHALMNPETGEMKVPNMDGGTTEK